MTGDRCGDEYVDGLGDRHACDQPSGHRGAHVCGLGHEVPSCSEDCCWEHPAEGASWANTPLKMALADWTIKKAEPGDIVLLSRQHPPHRAVEVIWNGETLVVVRQEHREVPYVHTAWPFYVVDRPGL